MTFPMPRESPRSDHASSLLRAARPLGAVADSPATSAWPRRPSRRGRAARPGGSRAGPRRRRCPAGARRSRPAGWPRGAPGSNGWPDRRDARDPDAAERVARTAGAPSRGRRRRPSRRSPAAALWIARSRLSKTGRRSLSSSSRPALRVSSSSSPRALAEVVEVGRGAHPLILEPRRLGLRFGDADRGRLRLLAPTAPVPLAGARAASRLVARPRRRSSRSGSDIRANRLYPNRRAKSERKARWRGRNGPRLRATARYGGGPSGSLSGGVMESLPELNPPQADAVAHVARAAPRLCRRRERQDPGDHLPHREPRRAGARRAVADPRRDLHEQGGRRDAEPPRAPDMLGPVARDLWVGTFHATCAKFLRLFPEAIERTKSFVIYDTHRSEGRRHARAARPRPRRPPLPAEAGARARSTRRSRRVAARDDMSLDSFMDDVHPEGLRRSTRTRSAPANALDFEDLILGVVRILEAPADGSIGLEVLRAKEALQKKFDYVLVDEFQDTNQIQYRLIKALAARTRNLCVVGDDDQSIYRWRGADVRNIRGFRKDYPDAKVVKLEQNYRSTKRIVSAALAVIAPSPTREPKELWTDNDDGSPIRVVGLRRRARRGGVRRAHHQRRARGRDQPEATSPSSTACTPSRASSKRRCAPSTCRTRSSAAPSSTSAPRSRTPSRTCVYSATRGATSTCSASSTRRRAASATRRSSASSAYASTQRLSLFEALERLDDFSEDLGTAAKKRLGQFRELMQRADGPRARIARPPTCCAWSSRRAATRRRSRPRTPRRPRGASRTSPSSRARCTTTRSRPRRAASSRRSTASSSVSRSQSDTDNLDKEGAARARHADDRARREGPRVRSRAPHRHGGGHVPLPEPGAAQRPRRWKRSGASPTSPSRARGSTSSSRTRDSARSSASRGSATPSRFIGDLPPETDRAPRDAGGARGRPQGRWIDRGGGGDHTQPTSWRSGGRSGTGRARARARAERGGIRRRAAQAGAVAAREPGERFVEYEAERGRRRGRARSSAG